MSGHSKWANIKQKKGKTDAARGSIFTKIGRELAVAVKQGGSDPANNSRLRDVIAKAKQNNMPNDNITRSIKKASGELSGINYEEITYEGYAAAGVAIIIEALTDNRNRTAGELRHLLDKYGGALGQTGCVSFMFKKKGVIIVDKTDLSEDDMMMLALDSGADDVIDSDDVYEVYTSAQKLNEVAEKIKEAKVTVLTANIDMIPDIQVDPKEHVVQVSKLIDLLEELDDVQNVYHNAILPEDNTDN
ncbi:MAG: YebC/PmpR family DNA-binding transcriptional regulator [Christensenellaceae bacterium]|jgi:YebC/PmpR family DNA-binding regulatory protein|nr:YebC/PmpR family DNA-binding transcriptional regulator [Christensenellaceae bacterium]